MVWIGHIVEWFGLDPILSVEVILLNYIADRSVAQDFVIVFIYGFCF